MALIIATLTEMRAVSKHPTVFNMLIGYLKKQYKNSVNASLRASAKKLEVSSSVGSSSDDVGGVQVESQQA